MSLSYRIKSYLRYRKKALSKHGVHSPFVFDLVTKVFPDRNHDYSEHIAEDWRTECEVDKTIIDVSDFGTGKSGPRKVFEIAQRSANNPAHGQLLNRIIRYFRPKKMLELG